MTRDVPKKACEDPTGSELEIAGRETHTTHPDEQRVPRLAQEFPTPSGLPRSCSRLVALVSGRRFSARVTREASALVALVATGEEGSPDGKDTSLALICAKSKTDDTVLD